MIGCDDWPPLSDIMSYNLFVENYSNLWLPLHRHSRLWSPLSLRHLYYLPSHGHTSWLTAWMCYKPNHYCGFFLEHNVSMRCLLCVLDVETCDKPDVCTWAYSWKGICTDSCLCLSAFLAYLIHSFLVHLLLLFGTSHLMSWSSCCPQF